MLDNFGTNLKPQPEPGNAAEPLWACQDPAWDRCLSRLAAELVGAPSRVLITSRRPLAALTGTACHSMLLGPLPAGEAALYLGEHAGLSKMVFSGDAGEKALALRLLDASRFHPLLMDRLARLATGGPALRSQLIQALTALEQSHDYTQLPVLFTSTPGDAKELAYLNDALATSLDQLIHDASPDARRLLWMIAVANDPVGLALLQGVWGWESHEQEQLRKIKQMLERLPRLTPTLQEKLKALPPEFRAQLDALPAAAPARSDPAPLLGYLVAVGLVTEERTGPDDANPDLTCHELVCERIRNWMRDHPQDGAELTENAVRLAYAERLAAVFKGLLHQNMTAALEAAAVPWSIASRPGPGSGCMPSQANSSQAPTTRVSWRDCSRTWRWPPSPHRRPAALVLPLQPRRCAARGWPPRFEPALLRAGRHPGPRRRRGQR